MELDKTLMARKDKVVNDLTKASSLFKKNRSGITGAAKITKPGEVEVTPDGGTKTYTARNTRSPPAWAPLPGVVIDEDKIVRPRRAVAVESAEASRGCRRRLYWA